MLRANLTRMDHFMFVRAKQVSNLYSSPSRFRNPYSTSRDCCLFLCFSVCLSVGCLLSVCISVCVSVYLPLWCLDKSENRKLPPIHKKKKIGTNSREADRHKAQQKGNTNQRTGLTTITNITCRESHE